MSKTKYILLLLLLFPFVSITSADTRTMEDIPKKDLLVLIKQCESCHGFKGNSTRNDIPSLAGKPVAESQEAIVQFYYYERHCPEKTPRTGGIAGSSTTMCSIASTLSEAEVLALGRYFRAHE